MHHLGSLAEADPQLSVMFFSAAMSDPLAVRGAMDFVEEEGMEIHPFKVGKVYLFQTVTLYYVGRVVAVTPCWVILEQASWVHWTGRLSTLMALGTDGLDHWPDGHRKPRTEYLGEWYVPVASLAGSGPWKGNPPRESIV